jgi:hypothetical protein
MKKLIIMAMVVLFVGTMYGQVTTTFEQLYRNNGTGASGSTWTKSTTHYTDWTSMVDVDSAWLVVDFPDSVACAIKVVNNVGGGVDTISALINADSTAYYVDGTGIATAYSLTGYYIQGFPKIRIQTIFSGTKTDTQGTEKYRYYIKKFRHK